MGDPLTRCRCRHSLVMHMYAKRCMWGHHPNRSESGWDEYREEYPECPCKEYEEER